MSLRCKDELLLLEETLEEHKEQEKEKWLNEKRAPKPILQAHFLQTRPSKNAQAQKSLLETQKGAFIILEVRKHNRSRARKEAAVAHAL